MSRLEELIQELCPDGVEYRSISDVSLHYTDGMHNLPKNILDTGMYPILSAQNISDGIIDLNTTKYVSEETFNLENKRTNVKYGDVLLTIVGAIGRVAVVETDLKALFQRSVCVITPDPNQIISRYLKYILESSSVQNYIQANAHGAAQKGLYLEQVGKIKIPVPPLEVQHEIVRILDSFTELTAELTTELTTELTARKQQYEYYRDKLLNFDGNIGDEVSWMSLKDLAKFTYGYTDKAQNHGDARFIRITDIDDSGCLNPDDAKYITISEDNRKYLLHKGDLLLARTGATYGKTLYVPNDDPAVYASFLIKITLDNEKILNRFYWHFSKSQLYWKQAERLVSKGGQQQFNAGTVGRVKVPVPPIEEQKKIINVLDNFDSICTDLSCGLPAEIEARQKQYEYYRDKLLSFKEKSA